MNTKFWNFNFPNEDEDPWYDGFVEYGEQNDKAMFGLLSSAAGLIVSPNITWNGGTGRLSWDADFLMPILGSGFLLEIKYGPDGVNRWIDLNDGDKVIVTCPVISSANVSANFSKVSGKMNPSIGLFVFGFRHGINFYANLPTKF